MNENEFDMHQEYTTSDTTISKPKADPYQNGNTETGETNI